MRPRIPLLLAVLLVVVSCGGKSAAADEPLRVGAIPDQDPEVLTRQFDLVSDYLSETLDVDVEYVPVTDYAASVSLFRTGDLDLVWFGGLTGVQARLETSGAEVIAQRDIDEQFHSVFVANTGSGIDPAEEVEDLDVLADRRFTFGSESSTSGRLMPQYFLDQAGVGPDDFAGEAGYSGSHDRTLELVESGSYEAGVLNEQVWQDRVDDGSVDTSKVQVIFRTPAYHDYHWVLHPSATERFGDGFAGDVRDALVALSPDDPDHAEILELFGAGAFIPSDADNYHEIEEIGRQLGLVND